MRCCACTGVADGASWTAEGCGASVVVGIGAFSVSLKAVSYFSRTHPPKRSPSKLLNCSYILLLVKKLP